MKKEIDDIINVEKTEEMAKSAAEHAKKKAADAVDSAKKKAQDMISDATNAAKESKENSIKNAIKNLEREHERVLSAAKKEAAKIKNMKISKNAIENIRKRAVSRILGE